VTDLVGISKGEAYDGNLYYYYEITVRIMKILIDSLPQWSTKYLKYEEGEILKE